MIYIFCILCLIIFMSVPVETQIDMGVSTDSLSSSFIYMFLHTSWLHLLLNIFCLILLWRGVWRLWERKFLSQKTWRMRRSAFLFLLLYFGAVLAGLICAQPVPTIGASGMVFMLLGMLLLLNPTRKQLQSFLWVAAALAVQIYFGKTNVWLHIISFIEGALLVIIRTLVHKRYEN